MVRGLEDVPFARLGDGVDNVRRGRGDLDPDASHEAREPPGGLRPGASAIGGAEDAALLVAGAVRPLLAVEVPHRRVQQVRVARVDVEVCRAVHVVDVEDLLPRLARVLAHEDAALLVRAEGVPDGRDIDLVGIERVDDDARDVTRVGEPEVAPGLATICGLVDPVPEGDRVAHVRFPGAHVDHVGVRRVEREVTDRLHGLLVEERRERGAGVRRLPHTTRRGPDVDDRRVAGNAFNVRNATRHVGRADVAVRERGKGGVGQ